MQPGKMAVLSGMAVLTMDLVVVYAAGPLCGCSLYGPNRLPYCVVGRDCCSIVCKHHAAVRRLLVVLLGAVTVPSMAGAMLSGTSIISLDTVALFAFVKQYRSCFRPAAPYKESEVIVVWQEGFLSSASFSQVCNSNLRLFCLLLQLWFGVQGVQAHEIEV